MSDTDMAEYRRALSGFNHCADLLGARTPHKDLQGKVTLP